MFDNAAFNVVIGLVFIFLLYSLLATVIVEIIATKMGLRARNLKEAIDRMLSDEVPMSFFDRLLDSLKLMKNPRNPVIEKFYNNPEIKYLGSTGIFRNPSSFKAVSFSRTLLYELNGNGILDKKNIETELTNLATPVSQNVNPPNTGVIANASRTLDFHAAQFVLSLFHDSQGDLIKFKIQLEAWFDRTMEQALEWYKRKIQIILLVLGFFMAWFFNADTFIIAGKLSNDKDAREKLVNIASAYLQNKSTSTFQLDSLGLASQKKLDSLLDIKKMLDIDINNANSILGVGGWLPDTVKLSITQISNKKISSPFIDEALIPTRKPDKINPDGSEHFKFQFWEKLLAFFSLLHLHFWGFLTTALAISLGAPFWFDLLNKLMKLRTSVKQPTDSTYTTNADSLSPLNRIG